MTDEISIKSPFYKDPVFWVRFAAYAIPLSFLLYVLYWNFLPFGYEKTFIIDVGSEGDTSGEFYLEPSRDLSERKTAPDGTTYRELNGMAYAIFKPKAVLKDAEITVSVEGDEGIEIIPPVIDFDPNAIDWDYSWDFTQGKTPEELGLVGNAFPFDGSMYFDGASRLELPNSADMFEDGPFTVYAEWTPTDDQNDFQQIVGHYNWEIWQHSDAIEFRVGRMNNAQGEIFSIEYPIDPEFFNQKHSLIATYDPSLNGYIQLYIDNQFIKKVYFSTDSIWENYGNQDLSFGWTPHNGNESPHFTGFLYKTNISLKKFVNLDFTSIFYKKNATPLKIPLLSSTSSEALQIKLNAFKR